MQPAQPTADTIAARSDPDRSRGQEGAGSSTVAVRAFGRLHLGFLDPDATLGRAFGSIGLGIDGFETAVSLSVTHGKGDVFAAADGDAQAAATLQRVEAVIGALRHATHRTESLQVRIDRALPLHSGLGSGTQLALATGRAFSEAFGLGLQSADIARITGRGHRSGVGVLAFDHGGLLVDGGPRGDEPPKLICRAELPCAWRAIVCIDRTVQGLSGVHERRSIASLPPLSQASAAGICHEVLMRVVPAVLDADIGAFAAGVTGIQDILGHHFAPAQGGQVFLSPEVERLIRFIASRTVAGIGQSSWGSAGFAIVASEQDAERVLAAARAAGIVPAHLDPRIVRPVSHGARVTRASEDAGSIATEGDQDDAVAQEGEGRGLSPAGSRGASR